MVNAVKSREMVMPGDVIWVHVRGNLWWPAQVFDEKMVSRSKKPSKKRPNTVLVRLYGTYTYLYRDPVKHGSEFEEILKQNNGSNREAFEKALEQDLSRNKPNGLKRNVTESREENGAETPKDKKSKNDANKMNGHKLNSPSSVTPASKVSSETSARRIKVMQNLGLVAPLGSPFGKNGVPLSK